MKVLNLFRFILMTGCLLLSFHSCRSGKTADRPEPGPMKVIFETDLGNDIDDALALDLLYKYADSGKVEILAIMINKPGTAPAEYADILNTWYGYQIPIGIILKGTECEDDAVNYARQVSMMKDGKGKPMFKRTLDAAACSRLPEASRLYREILSGQDDSSVVIISTGFSTNLSNFLRTRPDEISSMSGMELAASKVKLLVTMGGCFNRKDFQEYNIAKDVVSARHLFEDWPGALVTAPFELGEDILYPAGSIENDFGWAAEHPVVAAYKAYLPMPYDRPTWDLTSVLYAVEGKDCFTESVSGEIHVDEKGCTTFIGKADGNRSYLMADSDQKNVILSRFIHIITSPPANYNQ